MFRLLSLVSPALELVSEDVILAERVSAPERIELDPLVAPEGLRARVVLPLRGRVWGM